MNMTWKDARKKNDWRSCLTHDEITEIKGLEAKIKDLTTQRSMLCKQRQIIQNRATTRFRQRQGKQA